MFSWYLAHCPEICDSVLLYYDPKQCVYHERSELYRTPGYFDIQYV